MLLECALSKITAVRFAFRLPMRRVPPGAAARQVLQEDLLEPFVRCDARFFFAVSAVCSLRAYFAQGLRCT